MARQYRELETLGVPLKDMKPPKGDNIRPGPAFWLVLIVIGGTTIWQKASAPPKPVTDIRTGNIFSGVQAKMMLTSHVDSDTQTRCQRTHDFYFYAGVKKRHQEDSRFKHTVDSAYVT